MMIGVGILKYSKTTCYNGPMSATGLLLTDLILNPGLLGIMSVTKCCPIAPSIT